MRETFAWTVPGKRSKFVNAAYDGIEEVGKEEKVNTMGSLYDWMPEKSQAASYEGSLLERTTERCMRCQYGLG
jgi:hypothetical protein